MKLTKLSLLTLSLALGAFTLSACDQRPTEAKYTDRPAEYQAFSGATKHTKNIRPVEGPIAKDKLYQMTEQLVNQLFAGKYEEILAYSSAHLKEEASPQMLAVLTNFFSHFKSYKFGDRRYLGIAVEEGVDCQSTQLLVEFDNGLVTEFSTAWDKDGILNGVWFDYRTVEPKK